MAEPPPLTPTPRLGQAYLLLTLCSLAWGGNVVVSRLAVGEISPMALTCLRWVVVIVAFLLTSGPRLREDWPLLRQHWRRGLLMGACGFTVFSVCLYIGAYYTVAVNLAILQGALPVMVLIGALLLHGTRATALQIVGVLVTLVGVAVVACKGDWHVLATLSFNFGDLLMLIGCAFYAGYTLMLRRRPKMPSLSFFFLLIVGGFLSSAPLLLIEILHDSVVWPGWTGWALVLFVGLGPSLFAQRAFMRGVDLLGPSRAGIFVNLVPAFGALLSVALLGEPFSVYDALALALVLGGILLAEHESWGRSAR